MKITISRMGINGEGIGFYHQKPVFIMGALSGEIVECDQLKSYGNYYSARLVKICQRSKDRQKSLCPKQKYCGSCPLMITKYARQLQYKRELLEEALSKYCRQSFSVAETIASPQTLNYRNKCSLPVIEKDGELVNAMYQSSSNHPVAISNCFIHDPEVERIRKEVLNLLNRYRLKAYDHKNKKGIRHLQVRGFDQQYQVVIITGEDKLKDELIADIMKDERIVSLYQGINTVKNPLQLLPKELKLLAGSKNISLKLADYEVNLLPRSFYQLNSAQALNIYEKVSSLVEEESGLTVEAYCGVGLMSIMLAKNSKKVIGIDIEKSSIINARENAKRNHLENVEFICGDADEQISRIARKQSIDVLVVDPPRTGLTDEFMETIIKGKIRKLIYVSCNPATLAKNISVLSRHYSVELIQPYDMFPQTAHVETVVELFRKEERLWKN